MDRDIDIDIGIAIGIDIDTGVKVFRVSGCRKFIGPRKKRSFEMIGLKLSIFQIYRAVGILRAWALGLRVRGLSFAAFPGFRFRVDLRILRVDPQSRMKDNQ